MTVKAIRLALIFLLVFFCVWAISKTRAQDATAEPTETVSAPAPAPSPAPTPSDSVSIPWWAIVGSIITAVLAGYSAPRIIDSIRKNPDAIKGIENKVDELPDAVKSAINKINDTADSVVSLIKEAADGIPAASKTLTVDLSIISTEALLAELTRRGETTSFSASSVPKTKQPRPPETK